MYAEAIHHAAMHYFVHVGHEKFSRWRFNGEKNTWVRGTLIARAQREWAGGSNPCKIYGARSWIVDWDSGHDSVATVMKAVWLRKEVPLGGVVIQAPDYISGILGHCLQTIVKHERFDLPEGRPDRVKLPCTICRHATTLICIKCSVASDFAPFCMSCFSVHAETLEGKPPPRVGGHTGPHATRSFWSPHNARSIQREKRLPCSFCNTAGCSRYCHLCSDADHFVVVCDKCASAAATAAAAEDVSAACSVAPARTKRRRDDDGTLPAASADINPYARVYNESKRARRDV